MLTTRATAQTEFIGLVRTNAALRFRYVFANLSKDMIMKLKPALAIGLFAVTAALSLGAGAAADTPADAKSEKAPPRRK